MPNPRLVRRLLPLPQKINSSTTINFHHNFRCVLMRPPSFPLHSHATSTCPTVRVTTTSTVHFTKTKGAWGASASRPLVLFFFSFFFTLLMFIQIKLHVQNRNNDDDGRHQCQHPNDERGLETWCLRLELAGRGRWGRCS
jgi:hypothetical protein